MQVSAADLVAGLWWSIVVVAGEIVLLFVVLLG